MTYAQSKLLAHTEKNFVCVIEPARKITSWTNYAGNTYYNDFSISDEFLEYVTRVSSDGLPLSMQSSIPTNPSEFYWDWDIKRLYINIGANPSTKSIIVFFEIYFATKTINTTRDPLDSNTVAVYFDPRILNATIPQVDQNNVLLFGSNSGSIDLNNADGKFYVYDDVSFFNKTIKIYHVINEIGSLKLIYRGKIGTQSIDDSKLTFSYRQEDILFNNQINSYFATGTDASKGYFNTVDFPGLDPNKDGYAIRLIYGLIDDLIPINIDYAEQAATNNNRDWVVRSDATHGHQLSNLVLASPSSTISRVYIGTHYFQVEDAVKVIINGVPEYSFVTARGINYIDVFPSLSTPPLQSTADSVERSTIGYIKIKKSTGEIFNLAYDRDFVETIFANNTIGFVLTDNFEANHPGMTLFDPKGDSIFCRCYGKKHSNVGDNDSDYGNLMAANLILVDIFTEYLGLDSSNFNQSEIESLLTYSLGIAIPDKQQTVFPTYREIITKINRSVLGNIYFDDNSLLSYRLIGPLGASNFTLTDKILLSFKIDFNADDMCNQVTLFYYYKESANGSGNSSHQRINKFSDYASYLHEIEKSVDIYTNLIKQNEADELANRYRLIFEDWQRVYSFGIKTHLMESLIGDTITIERSKMLGYNYDPKALRIKNMKITRLKKSLGGVEADANDQRNIENNLGEW